MKTAADYLSKIVSPQETVTVPQWGDVTIRGLTAEEWDRHESASVRPGADGKSEYVSDTASLIRYAVVNEAGANVFSDAELPQLRTLPAEIARPLVKAIFKLCGIGQDLGKS